MLHFFFFNDTATTEIYTLSLHDALPIFRRSPPAVVTVAGLRVAAWPEDMTSTRTGRRSTGRWETSRSRTGRQDRKSTRLNSSHANISYAVFCLKKKKKRTNCKDVTVNHD